MSSMGAQKNKQNKTWYVVRYPLDRRLTEANGAEVNGLNHLLLGPPVNQIFMCPHGRLVDISPGAGQKQCFYTHSWPDYT